ncbi:hypothetical protein [Sphingomonas desiccabilis]|uniref:Uncharacterized protein n=1 Tax=Sphingomonas desiccabilis TaxID=429134 RepID=A0A4V1QPW0_9SPHN|nr:hypothetical protein [Sphingomonas desiccabilis]MBB3910528.1 hypothetical protein [Sphingomonas desiccabilis]RXZ35167.1 hypothetical protein EO081_05900 [Sphingomonas desiccabilis]
MAKISELPELVEPTGDEPVVVFDRGETKRIRMGLLASAAVQPTLAEARQYAAAAQAAFEQYRFVDVATDGPGAVAAGSVATANTARFDGRIVAEGGQLQSLTYASVTAGNAYAYLAQVVSPTQLKIFARHYGARVVGENTIPADAWVWDPAVVDRNLPERWTFGTHHGGGAGGAAAYLLANQPAGSSLTISINPGPDIGAVLTVSASTAPPRWSAVVKRNSVRDVAVSTRKRTTALETEMKVVRNGGAVQYTTETNFDQRIGFANANAVWSAAHRGVTNYVRQPTWTRSEGIQVFAMIEGRRNTGGDDDPAPGLFRRGIIVPIGGDYANLDVLWAAPPVELVRSFTVDGDGVERENACGNWSTCYDPATRRHWFLFKVRHVHSSIKGVVPDTVHAFYYDWATDEFRGAAGTKLALPFRDFDCISLDYLGAQYAAPPNSSGIVKKLAPNKGAMFFPFRYTDTVTPHSGSGSSIKLIKLDPAWIEGKPAPFLVTCTVPTTQIMHPGTGEMTWPEPGESSIAELPDGSLYVLSRSSSETPALNANMRVAYKFSGLGTALLGGPRYDPALKGQSHTGSLLVLSGLNDRQPFRMLYAHNFDFENDSSNSRAGIGVHMATGLDKDGWPLWTAATGALFPAIEVFNRAIDGSPASGSYETNNNAAALANLTLEPTLPVAGLMLDKRVRHPANGDNIYICSPWVTVKPSNLKL